MVDLLAAVLGRPNALDAHVTALGAQALLTAPPAALLDAQREAAARRLETFLLPVWAVTLIAQIVVLARFWSTGQSARMRDWMRARIGSEFGVRFCFGAALALIDRLAALIPQAFQYRFMRLMDLNELLFRTWLAHWIVGTFVTMIVVGIAAAIVLGLADRTHQWYLYTIAGVVGFTLAVAYVTPSIIAPATARFTPFVPGAAIRSDVSALERRTGIAVPVLEEHVSQRTRAGTAYVMGWGGTQRIVLPDTLVAGSTRPELRFLLARSLAWIAANLGLQTALIQSAFIVVGVALSVLIADRIGFRRDDDPVSRLALLGAVIGCVYVVALPFYHGYARRAQFSMDAAALALSGDRVAGVRTVIRNADQALENICPGRFAYWYLTASPSVGERIALLQGRPDVCSTQRP